MLAERGNSYIHDEFPGIDFVKQCAVVDPSTVDPKHTVTKGGSSVRRKKAKQKQEQEQEQVKTSKADKEQKKQKKQKSKDSKKRHDL
eukprot:COSAG05_NODE_2562_length_2898_cov_3.997856_4_plen_87_part_00